MRVAFKGKELSYDKNSYYLYETSVERCHHWNTYGTWASACIKLFPVNVVSVFKLSISNLVNVLFYVCRLISLQLAPILVNFDIVSSPIYVAISCFIIFKNTHVPPIASDIPSSGPALDISPRGWRASMFACTAYLHTIVYHKTLIRIPWTIWRAAGNCCKITALCCEKLSLLWGLPTTRVYF